MLSQVQVLWSGGDARRKGTGYTSQAGRAIQYQVGLFDAYGLPLVTSNGYQGSWTTTQPAPMLLLPVIQDPIGYKGQFGCYTDGDVDLVYCQNRFYNPRLRRWITPDPIGVEGGVNLYEFCDNNPVMEADPSGSQGVPSAAEAAPELFLLDGAGLSSADLAAAGLGATGMLIYASARAGWATGTWLDQETGYSATVGPYIGGLYETEMRLQEDPAYEPINRQWLGSDDDAKECLEEQYPFLRKLGDRWRKYRGVNQRHHLLPQEAELAAWFRSKDLNIGSPEFMYPMDAFRHRVLHGHWGIVKFDDSWSQRWMQYMRQNPNASSQDIRAHLRQMMQEFGLK